MKRAVARIVFLPMLLLAAFALAPAQTATQNINVTIRSGTTVEERVANEMKEKELRKAAEEKLAAEESAKIAGTNPQMLLSRAHTIYVYSDTSFFEEVQLQNALRKRNEFSAWQLALVDGGSNRSTADIVIDIDRPLFTYTFTYQITNRSNGIILATGKVTAIDGDAAAPLLADKIIEEIRKAKGEPKPKK